MADEAPNTAPTTDPAPAGEPTGAPGNTPPATDKAPTWDGPYDEARASQLITNLRAELAQAKAGKRQAPAATGDDDVKRQLSELSAELTKTRTEALDAAKRAAIADAKIPANLAAYVTGKTADELKASAEKVAADFAAGKPADTTPGRPKARLVPGHGADDDGGDFDAEAVAKAMRRR